MKRDAFTAESPVGPEPARASLPALNPGNEAKTAAAAASSRGGTVFALQARALGHERFSVAATAVATELALRLGCERVSIGFSQHGRLCVNAMSNTADIRSQQNVVRSIAAAMEEALDRETLVIYPMPPGSKPAVTLAHNELMQRNGQMAVCTVPIVCHGQPVGALLFERREGFDAHAIERAKDAALFVGPVLELKHRLDQPLRGRLVQAMSTRSAGLDGRRRIGAWQLGAITSALLLVALALWPASFRVVGVARVEGEGQRIIAAPVDGFVKTALLRPGELVKADQVLLTLDDGDLLLEKEKWSAETTQLDKLYREALSKDDAAQIIIGQSKLAQAQAQLDLVNGQLERITLKAPFDGVLLDGDLSQSAGMPVKRGQELMLVAPSRSYRIVVEVQEQDIADLQLGQTAQVLFAALPQQALTMTVTRISPVASVREGRSIFEVDGRMVGPTDPLRPGLKGVARIHIAERTLGWVWWHRTQQWARRTFWHLLS